MEIRYAESVYARQREAASGTKLAVAPAEQCRRGSSSFGPARSTQATWECVTPRLTCDCDLCIRSATKLGRLRLGVAILQVFLLRSSLCIRLIRSTTGAAFYPCLHGEERILSAYGADI